MMGRVLLSCKFFEELVQADQVIAQEAQQRGCPHCGGRLDVANFPRKPRGLPCDLGPAWQIRFSFSCAVDGCRRRLTPASLRFDRWVYVLILVVFAGLLASASKPSPSHRWSACRERLGLERRTWSRWLAWWRGVFPATPAGRDLRAQFVPSGVLSSVWGHLSGAPPHRMLDLLSRIRRTGSSLSRPSR